MGIVEETEAKLAALNLRLPELEGKANKRERTQVNKEIYALENDGEYVAAVKAALEGGRAAAGAADDAAHADKLKAEAAAEVERIAEAEAAAAAKRAAGPAAVEDDGFVGMDIAKRQHGDGVTMPVAGDKVGVTYKGTFPDGVEYQGTEYGGQTFDTTATLPAGKGKKKKNKASGRSLPCARALSRATTHTPGGPLSRAAPHIRGGREQGDPRLGGMRQDYEPRRVVRPHRRPQVGLPQGRGDGRGQGRVRR